MDATGRLRLQAKDVFLALLAQQVIKVGPIWPERIVGALCQRTRQGFFQQPSGSERSRQALQRVGDLLSGRRRTLGRWDGSRLRAAAAQVLRLRVQRRSLQL